MDRWARRFLSIPGNQVPRSIRRPNLERAGAGRRERKRSSATAPFVDVRINLLAAGHDVIGGGGHRRRARAWGGGYGVSMMTELRGASNAKAKAGLEWSPLYSSWRTGFRGGAGARGYIDGAFGVMEGGP